MAKKPKPKIKPIGSRVVVRPLTAEDVTPGGIVLPASVHMSLLKGKVVAVGRGEADLITGHGAENGFRPLEVQVDDVVTYPSDAGYQLQVDREDLTVLDERDCLLVIG